MLHPLIIILDISGVSTYILALIIKSPLLTEGKLGPSLWIA